MKGVIFDMDGCLCDSELLINEAAIAMFREQGHTVQPDDFLPFIGAGETRYIMGVAEKYGIALNPEQAKLRTYEIYLALVPDRLKAFPGAVELVKACKQAGLKIALASSADRMKIDANLNAINLPPSLWDALTSAEDVTHKKPAPDIFLKAATKLNLLPEQCTVIEDAQNGVQAGKAASMRTYAVAHTFSADKLHEADRVFPSIGEIKLEDLLT